MKKFNKPHIKNGRFCHDLNHRSAGFFFSSVFMMLKSLWLRASVTKIEAESFVCKQEFLSKDTENPVITWLGHASFLIQIGGVNILTDPVLGEACVLYKFLYKRRFKVGIPADKLPNIDFVLISHNHMDHMDAESLISLKSHKNIHFLVPQGNKKWFESRGFDRVREYNWWDQDSFSTRDFGENISSQEAGFKKNINFSFLPASHWSQRGVFDKNKTLWGSWLIEYNLENNGQKINNLHANNSPASNLQINSYKNSFKIFFAGDTAYDTHFKEISQDYQNIDVALMPIGPCEPRKFVAHHHVDAQEAVNAFLDLNAQHFVPMHWGTFPLGAEAFDLPITKLVKSWFGFYSCGLLDGKKLHLPKIGEQIEFSYPDLQVQVSGLQEQVPGLQEQVPGLKERVMQKSPGVGVEKDILP